MIKSITTGMLFLSSLFMLTGCGSSSSSGSSSSIIINAPASVAGKSYRMTISSGSGIFATTGRYEVTLSTNTYTIVGDGVNVPNSNGTYTYSASSNIGTASVSDSITSLSGLTFVFTSNSGGTFNATANTAPVSQQSGTFSEI